MGIVHRVECRGIETPDRAREKTDGRTGEHAPREHRVHSQPLPTLVQGANDHVAQDNEGHRRWHDEIRDAPPAGEQFWGFFNGTGEGEAKSWRKTVLAIRPMPRPPGRFEMFVIAADDSTIKELSTLTKAELDTEFEYWHAQLRLWVNTARRRQQGETGCPTCPL
jgi:hypothetical protein